MVISMKRKLTAPSRRMRHTIVVQTINGILKKAKLTEEERLALATLCNGPKSAEDVADLLELSHMVQANRLLGRAGHKIFDASPPKSFVRNWHPKDWDGGWYHVAAPGRRSEVDKKFYWEVRPMIRRAFIEEGWYALPCNSKAVRQSYETRLEGAEVLRLLSIRERDPDLRKACLDIHGYRCFVCGNDLGEIYGEIGKGFIHVHHLRPLGRCKIAQRTDPKKDLIPVCPNCHSIIHRGGGTRSPEEIRMYLTAQSARPRHFKHAGV
jgi:predicted HNH restriction endonuclease